MNEKIKRLLQQIKGETYSPLGLSTIYGTSKLYGMTEEEITQFAELIIQECLNVVEATSNESADLGRTVLENSAWINSDINRYFGIK